MERSLIVQGDLGPEQGLTLSYARVRLAVALLMLAKVDVCCAMALESIQPLQRSGILIARGDLDGASISERMADAAALQESVFAHILLTTLRTSAKRGTVGTD